MIAALIAISLAQSQPPPKAPPPSLPPELSDLLEDPSSINDFDYMALKHAGADLKAASDAVYASAFRDDRSRCLTPAEAALQQHLAAAEIAASTAEFKADKDAADRAWSLWTEFAASVMRGDQANPPFDAVSTRIREVQLEDHPRAKDLLTRTAKDQLYRHGFTGADQARASNAAWLMAQHADRDPQFQAMMEPLVKSGEVSLANYAYLFDRIAVGADRPQRYGTQGRCTGPELWEPNTLENE
ncbi:hypothetical protein LTR94_024562, partial [Friedmanniomyces endolithicus]